MTDPAPDRLFCAPYEDAAVAALFGDTAWVDALIRVEIALAQAQAKCGAIPAGDAGAIAAAGATFAADPAGLAAGMRRDGFPIIELVAQFRRHVGGKAAAHVHWGATTQDIMDTALVLQLQAALAQSERHLTAMVGGLSALATRHRDTVMVGRTHLQPALPVTFGLKAAGWLEPFVRHAERLRELRGRLLVVQFGGAAGTLASLDKRGPAVAAAFAKELGLGVAPMPWHAQRDNLLEAAAWFGLGGGSLAKFAQDILLLAQAEVGEVRESDDPDRGGSSAMPQKRNPVASETVLVAVRSAAAHLAALQSAPPPEHERGTQTAQLELLHLPRLAALTAGALQAGVQLAAGLVVDPARMRANLDATHGSILSERLTLALAAAMEPAAARQLVREAAAAAVATQRHLVDIVREKTRAQLPWEDLRDPSRYLGSAGTFIDQVLTRANALQPSR